MKRFYILIIYFSVTTISACAQVIWNFDGKDSMIASDGSLQLSFHSVKEKIELSKGMIGKGLRTDGYSTWLSSIVDHRISSFSGWFALESLPTDTAAFFGARDKQRDISVSICVNQFGKLMLGIGSSTSYSYHDLGNKYIKSFKWMYLTLSFEQDHLSVYLNGEKIGHRMTAPFPFKSPFYLQIGKDFREKKVGLYNVTTINGLIDEIRIDYNNISGIELFKDVKQMSEKVPTLAIPKSRFATDFNRPHYHLLPAANWTNETHGLIYYKGKYHIFNQKNASAIFLGQINWGHFSSPDLIHWTEEKPALTPGKSYDKNGIWSGCAILDNKGIPQIIYTAGGDKTTICTAFAKDDKLIEWLKYKHNPIIKIHPERYTRTDMRDPFVWKEKNKWYMIVGYGIENKENPHGALLLYKSNDLKRWTFVHLLFEGNPNVDHSGVFWEMPLIEKMGNKYILLINRVPFKGIPACSQYWVGQFKNEKFIPDNNTPKNLEVINRLLSPSVLRMQDGNIVAIAIIPDEIGNGATYKHGWAHLYSLPRIWQLKEGKITQSPYPALKDLRDQHSTFKRKAINYTEPYIVSKTKHQLEVKATFYPGNAKTFGFILCKNPDNSEYSRIYYDVKEQEFIIDQTKSSLRQEIPLRVQKRAYYINCSKPLEIHLFIDGSVIEGFINNEDAFSTRIFPLKANSTQVELFSDGTTTEVKADIWTLKDAKIKMNF